MKLNWASGVVMAFLLFAAGVFTMVFIAMNREVDLVTDDYYEQELQHQDQIDRARRSAALGERPLIRINVTSVDLIFPPFFKRGEIIGSMYFYRPASRNEDFIVPLNLDSTNIQRVFTNSLEKGLWRLKLRWTYKREEYFQEEVVVLP